MVLITFDFHFLSKTHLIFISALPVVPLLIKMLFVLRLLIMSTPTDGYDPMATVASETAASVDVQSNQQYYF